VASHFGTAVGQVVQQRHEVPWLPVWLPPRPTWLVGREDLLAELDARLSVTDGRWPRVVALCGLGGAGKTSVAMEYAHRHLAEVGLAWQFPAEDPTALTAEFSRLAAQLGVRDLLDVRDPVASVHAVLAAFPAAWLLVFDNAPGQEAVQRFLPPAGRGRVLITSQSAVWAPGRAVEVPVLDTEVAAGFLVNRTGDPDHRAAVWLAEGLGGLPLGLEQAAAYIQATEATLTGYLSMFRQRQADLLARGEAIGHPADVAATLGLALSRLADENPAAAGLLRLLARLAPEPVPWTLLFSEGQVVAGLDLSVVAALGPLLGDPIATGDAISALRRYSLVTPAGDGLVLVHRLVQAITRGQISPAAARAWDQAAAALVRASIPSATDLPSTWPLCAPLLPHARAVLGLASFGMRQMASYLGHSGSYLAARDLFRLIAGAYQEDEAFGPEHRDTLAARTALARWTGEAGDAAGARDQLAALLPVEERVLGPENPDTLTARAALAGWTGTAGDPARARDQLAALLPVEERVLGPENPDTLTARAALARWTGEAGDPPGARDQCAASLAIREQVLGPAHPDTLTGRAALAYWTGEAGDPAEARDQIVALLPVQERVLGSEHPDTLTARANLANWTGQTGNVTGARDQYAALLAIREQVLGPEHPDTLTARANLAYWTGQTGDAARARDQLVALLAIRERVLGPEHPDTLTARANLAYWTGQTGDAARARDQYAALLPIRERVSGPEHPHTLTHRANLTYWTRQSER